MFHDSSKTQSRQKRKRPDKQYRSDKKQRKCWAESWKAAGALGNDLFTRQVAGKRQHGDDDKKSPTENG
jgi:hypothetical protein